MQKMESIRTMTNIAFLKAASVSIPGKFLKKKYTVKKVE